MSAHPEFSIEAMPTVTVEHLLIDAEETAAFFGGDDYILGRNDSAIGPYRHRDPGTLNWTKILFNADRFRDINTNKMEHFEYELEFESAEELDDDQVPEGLLAYAVSLFERYHQHIDPYDIKIMMNVETGFEVDSDGDFTYGSEIYYSVAGHEIVVVEGNGFAERYSPSGEPLDDSRREQAAKENQEFELLMKDVEDGVNQEQLQAARHLLEFLVQANIPSKSTKKSKVKANKY